MELDFGEMKPELGTLCKYQFPRFQSGDACRRFAPQNARKFEAEGNEFEEQYFESGDKQPPRRHVFANVWERSLDPRGSCPYEESPDGWNIDYRGWPPEPPKLSRGVKIPLEFNINPELRILEASASPGCFYSGLKGLLNPCQSTALRVSPPALLFLNSKPGHFYTAKLKLLNIDPMPHRIKVIPPQNPAFQIDWSNRSGRSSSLAPGLAVALNVIYRPRSSAPINELLFIGVEGEGGVTVPLIAAAEPPPILEMDEMDVGCSVVNVVKSSIFEIRNVGSGGRFWFLTHDEFNYQYMAYPKRRLPPSEVSGKKKAQRLPGTFGLSSGPFLLDTPAFSLLRNQRLRVRLSYAPTTPGVHISKLALLCDNGECRWLAVRGSAIDLFAPDAQFVALSPLPTSRFWSAPAVDLPFESGATYALDFGDMAQGGEGQELKFRATNRSCVSLYYWWGVRPLETKFGAEDVTLKEVDDLTFQKFFEGSVGSVEFLEEEAEKEKIELLLSPAQGILGEKEMKEFTLGLTAPTMTGYYACVLSLYIDQIDDDSMADVTAFLRQLESKGGATTPIHRNIFQPPAVVKEKQKRSTLIVSKTDDMDEEEEMGEENEIEETEENEIEETEENEIEESVKVILSPKPKLSICGQSQQDLFGPIWSPNASTAKPILELEIWLRSLPIQLSFFPPFILGTGPLPSKLSRTLTVHNDGQWPLELKFKDPLSSPAGHVCINPFKITLEPFSKGSVNAVICLKGHGKITGDLVADVNVLGSNTKAQVSVPCSVTCTDVGLISTSPLLHFGCLQQGKEAMKSIGISNGGNKALTWTAGLNSDPLKDDQGRNLSPGNCTILKNKLIRLWPSWGILEPGETSGINVYLCAELAGELAASVTIKSEINEIVVPLYADVQAPLVYLEESTLVICAEGLRKNGVGDGIVALVNPCGFSISYAFQPCLVGEGADELSVEFCPGVGFVPPGGSTEVVVSLMAKEKEKELDLKAAYSVVIVDGMKEPLVIKIQFQEDD